jgi:hypothetical protein
MYATVEYGLGFEKEFKVIVKSNVDETRNRCGREG